MTHIHAHHHVGDRRAPWSGEGADLDEPGRDGRRRRRGGPRRGGPHGGPHGGRRGPHGRWRREDDFREAFLGPMDGPGFRRSRRGPGRGRRGDVRAAVLALLKEEPANGYQLMNRVADRSEGLWRPSAGSIYPALGQLEDEGLIQPADVDGRKVFELTDAGRSYVAEHEEEVTDPWQRVASPHQGYLDVRQEMKQLAMALQQVVVTGDPDQVRAARTVLDDARRALYRILAGDAPQDADADEE
jgi:DNA-binding PadR family transcriptional regulator